MKHDLRNFQKKDAKAVVSMLRKLAAFHGEKSLAKPEHFLRYATGRNPLSQIVVAFVGQTPVGFIETEYQMNFLRGLFMARVGLLFVEEKYRGQGIGKDLFLRAMKEAQKKGCERLDVCALPSNKTSNAFYLSLGLERKRNNHFAYKADKKCLRALCSGLKVRE